MDTKFIKSTMEKKKYQQTDQHISAIAGSIFGIVLVIAVLGAIFGDGKFPDAVLGA